MPTESQRGKDIEAFPLQDLRTAYSQTAPKSVSFGTPLVRRSKWTLPAFCKIGLIWLLLAVNLIVFNVQRPVGFVFLGLAALSIMLGLFPWQYEVWHSTIHVSEDRPCQEHGSVETSHIIRAGGHQNIHGNEGWKGRLPQGSPKGQSGPYLSTLHGFGGCRKEHHDLVADRQSSSSQSYSPKSSISSDRLNSPLPPVPTLKQPLISSILTQSSASVRPQHDLVDDKNYGRPFPSSKQRPTDYQSPPVSCYWSSDAYDDIELAVDSAYHLPLKNDIQLQLLEEEPNED